MTNARDNTSCKGPMRRRKAAEEVRGKKEVSEMHGTRDSKV